MLILVLVIEEMVSMKKIIVSNGPHDSWGYILLYSTDYTRILSF